MPLGLLVACCMYGDHTQPPAVGAGLSGRFSFAGSCALWQPNATYQRILQAATVRKGLQKPVPNGFKACSWLDKILVRECSRERTRAGVSSNWCHPVADAN